ncbi:MAG: C2H2-type zinc finger protein, partial [Planctomycetes bacterium]|nr:C2H2-type zinc finger protein [Planctomycetota bacterium]
MDHQHSSHVRRYKCDHCDYSTVRKDDLKKHLKTHFPDFTNNKQKSCTDLSKKVQNRNSAEVIISAFKRNHLVSSDEEEDSFKKIVKKNKDVFSPEREKKHKRHHSSKHDKSKAPRTTTATASTGSSATRHPPSVHRSKVNIPTSSANPIPGNLKVKPNDPLIVKIVKARPPMIEDCKIVVPDIATEVIVPENYKTILESVSRDSKIIEINKPENQDEAMKKLYAGSYNILTADLELSNDTIISDVTVPTTDNHSMTETVITRDSSCNPIPPAVKHCSCSPMPLPVTNRACSPISTQLVDR